jgi:hypothetical protein
MFVPATVVLSSPAAGRVQVQVRRLEADPLEFDLADGTNLVARVDRALERRHVSRTSGYDARRFGPGAMGASAVMLP